VTPVLRSAAIAVLVTTMPVAAVTHAATDRTEKAFFDFGAALARGLPAVPSSGPAPLPLAPAVAETVESAPAPDAPPKGKSSKHAKHGRRPDSADLGVYIDERKISELARLQAMPAGKPVPSNGTRPSGIALFGVAGLGVGLRDGDVLTAVEGRSVQAEGQVVGIVVGMLARHARRISGEFWRGNRRGSIVVEVPVVRLAP
jgi:S1-C subfamily serine protease